MALAVLKELLNIYQLVKRKNKIWKQSHHYRLTSVP